MKDVEWVIDQMVASFDTTLSVGKKRRSAAHGDAPPSKRGRKKK